MVQTLDYELKLFAEDILENVEAVYETFFTYGRYAW